MAAGDPLRRPIETCVMLPWQSWEWGNARNGRIRDEWWGIAVAFCIGRSLRKSPRGSGAFSLDLRPVVVIGGDHGRRQFNVLKSP